MSLSAYVIVNRQPPHKIKIIGEGGKIIDEFEVTSITVEQDKADIQRAPATGPYLLVNISKN
jgi:negative regulator of sigma E activity